MQCPEAGTPAALAPSQGYAKPQAAMPAVLSTGQFNKQHEQKFQGGVSWEFEQYSDGSWAQMSDDLIDFLNKTASQSINIVTYVWPFGPKPEDCIRYEIDLDKMVQTRMTSDEHGERKGTQRRVRPVIVLGLDCVSWRTPDPAGHDAIPMVMD